MSNEIVIARTICMTVITVALLMLLASIYNDYAKTHHHSSYDSVLTIPSRPECQYDIKDGTITYRCNYK